MKLDADILRRLSPLLEQALDLDESARELWLADLRGDSAELAPVLRELLLRQTSRKTADRLDRGPDLVELAAPTEAKTSEFHAGDTIGSYQLIRQLGVGGMGEVWLADRSDGTLKREVALKLPQYFLWRPGTDERFAAERDILARLEHPNIARLYDAGLSSADGPGRGLPYLALEYVKGISLTAYCDQHRLDLFERLTLAIQVLEAVQYAHTRLVIHRDIKPANILVTEDGQVRLLDFGVARLMTVDGDGGDRRGAQQAGQAFTADYASPEQIRGEDLSTASDVYSLGVVLYELLGGQRPYRLKHGSLAQLEQAINEADPQPPSSLLDATAAQSRSTSLAKLQQELRGDLDAIVLKALKKRPEERYPTVAELAEDLRRQRRGDTVRARPDSFAYRAQKYILRHKIIVGSAVSVFLAIATGLTMAFWEYRQAVEQATIARDEARTSAAVQGFMQDIFRVGSAEQPDPAKARKTTAEQLLDIAAGKMETAMHDAPLARLKMLRVLTDLYVQQGLYNKAIATSRLAVETASRPEIAPDELLASMEQSEKVLDFALRLDEAEQMLQRRIALLKKLKNTDPKANGKIELALGGLALQLNPAEALRHIELAIEMLRSTGSEPELMEALLYKANLLNGAAFYNPAVARACALEAQEIFLRIKATPAFDGVKFREANIYQELAQSSMMLDDLEGAVKYARLAEQSALSMNDQDNNMARWHSYVLAIALTASARPLEAIEFLDHSWRLSDPRSPEVESPQQMMVLMANARAQIGAGRSEEALSTIDRSMRLSKSVSMQPHWPARLLAARSMALLQLGQIELAQTAMNEAISGFEAAKQSTEALLLLTAELNLARRDTTAARTSIQDWMASPKASVSLRDRLRATTMLAEAALMAGDWPEYEKLNSELVHRINSYAQRPALADLEARALWLLGRANLARDDPVAALPVLKQAVLLQEQVVDLQVSLNLAGILANLAQAQWRTSNAADARRTLERMKRIHARHQNLGPAPRSDLVAVARELAG